MTDTGAAARAHYRDQLAVFAWLISLDPDALSGVATGSGIAADAAREELHRRESKQEHPQETDHAR